MIKYFVALVALPLVSASASTPPDPVHELSWHQLPSAKCLDGSPAGYYRKIKSHASEYNTRKPLFVYFEGGGWCYGMDRNRTLHDCARRAAGYLGSSKAYAWKTEISWYMKRVSQGYDYVHVPYCDGTSLSGNAVVKYNATFSLHFDGRRILDELVD